MRLEADFGFGSLGLVCLAGELDNRDLLLFDRLRTAVEGTIDRAYATALEVLSQNRSALEALAAALFSAGYLDRTEIDAILAQTPLCSRATDDATPKQPPRLKDALPGETVVEVAGAAPFISSETAP